MNFKLVYLCFSVLFLIHISVAASERDVPSFAVQIGLFEREKNACIERNRLVTNGYPAFIQTISLGQKIYYQVCVGLFESKREAHTTAQQLVTARVVPDALVVKQTDIHKQNRQNIVDCLNCFNAAQGSVEKKEQGLTVYQKKAYLNSGKGQSPDKIRFAKFLAPKVYAEINPGFSWQLYYEDNVYATPTDRVSDFSNRYEPKLQLNIKTDRSTFAGEGSLKIIEYVDERDYNTVDQDYTVELSYLLNKRSTISISGGYSVNTDPNRYFQLEPEDIGSLALVGTYVVKKYKTKTKTATGSYQYMLSPRSLITGTVMYSNFDTGVTDSSDFYMGLLQYQYDLSKTVKCNLIGSYNYMRFKFGGKADEGDIDFLEDLVSGGDYEVFFGSDFKSKMYSASAGLAYMFGKGSNINASLGWIRNVQNIKTETTDPETGDLITATRRPDGNTLNYNIGYTYSFSGSTIKLGLKQNAGDNANTGVSYRSRDLDLRIMHDINRRLAGNLTLKYYRYHSDEDDFGFEIKRHILYIMSNITYRATRWLNISLNYQYTNNHNKNIGRRTERNSVFFALTFQPLRPFVIR